MAGATNDIITGKFDYRGEAIVYGDSVTGDTVIETDTGAYTIEQLFSMSNSQVYNNDKYYGSADIKVLSYNQTTKTADFFPVNHFIKHYSDKILYEIELEDGKKIKVTEDHSIMVERNGELIEIKPTEITENDYFITVENLTQISRHKIKKVTNLGPANQDVYDISIQSSDRSKHTFFANGILVHNTDSVIYSSLIDTSWGTMTIEELFERCSRKWNVGDKEYSADDVYVRSLNTDTHQAVFKKIEYVYRHRVTKEKWEVYSENTCITTTGDHSIMVVRDGNIIECKPRDILPTDQAAVYIDDKAVAKPLRVHHVGEFNDEYVYDIGIPGCPYFFANNILVHNSCYFSAYKPWKDDPLFKDFEWTKENVIETYDKIADSVNETFSPFMMKNFHVTESNSQVIKAGREVVGSRGLFLAKKRYAIMVIDTEGKRMDVNGKPGKIKAMGIETKRSDTPKFIQEFLEDMLAKVLTGGNERDIVQFIRDFRERFDSMPSYRKGTPRAIKNYDKYKAIQKNDYIDPVTKKKANLPGHATASLNYMRLKDIFNDHYSMSITNGTKITVCKLKPGNNFNMDSIAIPNDLLIIPDWIKQLPYDDDAMAESLIDTKVNNLIGLLGWDLDASRNDTNVHSLFDFG